MSNRIIFVTALAVLCLAGCQSSMFAKRFQRTVGYHPGSVSREDPGSQSSDPWIQEAGTITRTEHPNEPVNDPLGLREVFVSQKARDIERNLGVGD